MDNGRTLACSTQQWEVKDRRRGRDTQWERETQRERDTKRDTETKRGRVKDREKQQGCRREMRRRGADLALNECAEDVTRLLNDLLQ